MRMVIAALAAGLCLAGTATLEAVAPAPAREAYLKQSPAPRKPGSSASEETCRWARDNECDEPVIGTGACPAHSDYSDCRYIRYGESDACVFANDGECDEPHFGTGACAMGSDRSDCGDVSALRFRDDSCASAFNGVCEEPSAGGTCAPRTDRTDCIGRERPMAISDHFFGRDDRQLMDTSVFPWSVIGEATFSDGEMCTATLVGPDVLVTAAHCISRDSGIRARGEFVTGRSLPGGPVRANIVGHFVERRFNRQQFQNSREVDGFDWALLRIDQRLGDRLGFIPVHAGLAAGEQPDDTMLYQAGYSWDTGERLSGNLGCRVADVFADNTFAHECDTTHGDSGSPFLVRTGDSYALVGVDSRFRSNPGGAFLYIAVNSNAFAPYVEDFAARRIGPGELGPRKR